MDAASTSGAEPPSDGRKKPWLVPHIVVEHISDIDPEILKTLGRSNVLIDLDNTLLGWGSDELEPEVSCWVTRAIQAGLKICILSNSRSYRVAYYALKLGVPYVAVALKPSRTAARGAMRLLGSAPQDTVIIGDQIFTDILLGNRLGMYTILVKPLIMREQMWMRLVRRIERKFWPVARERRPPPPD